MSDHADRVRRFITIESGIETPLIWSMRTIQWSWKFGISSSSSSIGKMRTFRRRLDYDHDGCCREEGGALRQLPAKHIDCGAGFERLVAVMQQKTSNYDTDSFQSIFKAIETVSHVNVIVDCFFTSICRKIIWD